MLYYMIAGDQDHAATVIAGTWALMTVTLIVTALRLWSQIISKRVIGWDDILINYACIIQVIYTIIMTLAALSGFGAPKTTVLSPEQSIQVAKLILISECLILSIFSIGKSSVAIFQLRIVIIPWQRYLLWFIIITVNLFYYILIPWDLLQCSPTAHLWDPSIPAKCHYKAIVPYSVFLGAYGGACDLILALLPWKIVWNLQLRRKIKFGVALAMSAGIFAGISSVMKAVQLAGINKGEGVTYQVVSVLKFLGCIEVTFTAVGACLPTLRPLFTRYSPSLRSISAIWASRNILPVPVTQAIELKTSSSRPKHPVYLGTLRGESTVNVRFSLPETADDVDVIKEQEQEQEQRGRRGGISVEEGVIRVTTESWVVYEDNVALMHGNSGGV